MSSRPDRSVAFYFTNLASIATGVALVAWAIRSNRAWFDRHVLPNYCPCAPSTLVYETLARWGAAALAVLVVVGVRPWILRRLARPLGATFGRMAARVGLAIAFALVACDVFFRIKDSHHRLEDEPGLPPMRIDDTGNYVPIPSRMKDSEVQGRPIRYAIDAAGNRAANVENIADPEAPTILFTGESLAMGWGVAYEDSYAALVGRALGFQSVNLSVTGFSSDQAYLRLRDALPRFARPVALVTIVVPVQLERNVNNRRQRLALVDDRLEVVGASRSPLLTSPLFKLLPYHSEETLRLTRAVVRATEELARRRGARSLFVFTNFGPPCLPDERGSSSLERTLFAEVDAAYVRVDILPELMIRHPKELHPNEKGHLAIAAAIVAALRSSAVATP